MKRETGKELEEGILLMSSEFSTLVSSSEDESSFSSSKQNPHQSSTLSYLSLLFCAVALSVDYAIIMPSLYLFLLSIDPDVNEALLGVALSSFQLASVLLSPLFGLWLDRRPMKEVIVAQLWISIAGNLFYSLSSSVWQIILARFVCGIGSTVGLCANVYVIRTTTQENRSSAFSKLSGSTLLGLLCGPAFNYPLTRIPHFQVFGLEINSLNAAGLMMVLFLLLAVGLIHLLFREPVALIEEDLDERKVSWFEKAKSIASFASIALALCLFMSSMNQLSLETSLPPITRQMWDFAQLDNSLVYTVLTVYLLVWYLILGLVLTKRLSDRVLLLIAWLFVGVGTAFLLVFGFVQDGVWYFWQFCVGASIIATSIPFFDSSGTSLFSKLQSDPKLQARSQSFLSSVRGIGILVGPLAASSLLTKGPIWVFVFVASCFVLAFPLFLLSFRLLNVKTKIEEVQEE